MRFIIMAGKSKRKGSKFENDIAKFLNQTYNTEMFARTPGSGAWVGKSNAQKRSGVAAAAQETLRGDLITPSDFPYVIECKFYESSPSYNKIIHSTDAKLDQWLSEVEYDAEQCNLHPMLWFKTTRQGTFVAVPIDSINMNINDFNHALKYKQYIIVGIDVFEAHSSVYYQFGE